MTHFPQPDPERRADRAKIRGSVSVTLRLEGGHSLPGNLSEISSTGGLMLLSKSVAEGQLAEVSFETVKGHVKAMVQTLEPRKRLKAQCLQPFRFVALEDEQHATLEAYLSWLLSQNAAHQ